MLAAIVCACSGAEQRARKAFRKAELPNWLEIPVYKGRDAQQTFWASVPPEAATSLGAQVLRQHLANKGSYNVIVGFTETEFVWASIHNASVKEQLDALVIARDYA